MSNFFRSTLRHSLALCNLQSLEGTPPRNMKKKFFLGPSESPTTFPPSSLRREKRPAKARGGDTRRIGLGLRNPAPSLLPHPPGGGLFAVRPSHHKRRRRRRRRKGPRPNSVFLSLSLYAPHPSCDGNPLWGHRRGINQLFLVFKG